MAADRIAEVAARFREQPNLQPAFSIIREKTYEPSLEVQVIRSSRLIVGANQRLGGGPSIFLIAQLSEDPKFTSSNLVIFRNQVSTVLNVDRRNDPKGPKVVTAGYSFTGWRATTDHDISNDLYIIRFLNEQKWMRPNPYADDAKIEPPKGDSDDRTAADILLSYKEELDHTLGPQPYENEVVNGEQLRLLTSTTLPFRPPFGA